ncbi:hypothetical protein Dsin_007227 [Dipteronia sinensis]|uniref:BZIP domain-containing protein n=1 Tax=Dipteronia sinensis TaxID=43782 RepID=A0AAE0EI78_9ROSI|nr:hypothetical protein Dsin_007227 [Dipteronia sinensis]
MKAEMATENFSLLDSKKMKRLIANREAARRRRLGKEYLRDIDSIQKKMNLMDAKTAYYENEIKRLKKENNEMMEFCAAAEIDIAYEEARCKALKEERKAIIRTRMMRNGK